MTCIDVMMKRDDLVTICDATKHILPSNSAKEDLINYSILCLSLRVARVLKHYITLDYFSLHYINYLFTLIIYINYIYYITLPWYFATCTVCISYNTSLRDVADL